MFGARMPVQIHVSQGEKLLSLFKIFPKSVRRIVIPIVRNANGFGLHFLLFGRIYGHFAGQWPFRRSHRYRERIGAQRVQPWRLLRLEGGRGYLIEPRSISFSMGCAKVGTLKVQHLTADESHILHREHLRAGTSTILQVPLRCSRASLDRWGAPHDITRHY